MQCTPNAEIDRSSSFQPWSLFCLSLVAASRRLPRRRTSESKPSRNEPRASRASFPSSNRCPELAKLSADVDSREFSIVADPPAIWESTPASLHFPCLVLSPGPAERRVKQRPRFLWHSLSNRERTCDARPRCGSRGRTVTHRRPPNPRST